MSRNTTTRFALLIGAAACCVLFLLASPGDAEDAEGPSAERFRANAISLGGLRVGGTSPRSGTALVDFVIQRKSTDAERNRLLEVLKTGGRGELWKTLGKMDPVGRIQIRGRLGYDLRYARELAGEDGQRILILATDRRILFEEVRDLTRSRDYDISVIELVLDAEGKGSGTAMPAVQVALDPETGDISLTNLNTSPVQLTNVRKTK